MAGMAGGQVQQGQPQGQLSADEMERRVNLVSFHQRPGASVLYYFLLKYSFVALYCIVKCNSRLPHFMFLFSVVFWIMHFYIL